MAGSYETGAFRKERDPFKRDLRIDPRRRSEQIWTSNTYTESFRQLEGGRFALRCLLEEKFVELLRGSLMTACDSVILTLGVSRLLCF